MTQINFDRAFEFRYGEVQRLSPLVRRVVARNPGPFTFYGTSTFIIGNKKVAVIDPGPALPQHIAAIVAATKDETVTHIVATHTHADHSPGCRPLQAQTGAPIYGFGAHTGHDDNASSPASGIDHDFAPDHQLRDGGVIAGLDWHLRAVHTPGHCANHICLALPEENTLFCGDQVMAWASTVIPADGDLRAYLASLDLLLRRPETTYRPTHGAAIHADSPSGAPSVHIKNLINHRHRRIDEVAAALKAGMHEIPILRAHIYRDLDSSLHAAAELSIRASLRFLLEEGKVKTDSDSFGDAKFFVV